MNILSHYFIDRNHPSPYYLLGVIMPDLIAHFNQKLRKPVFQYQTPDSTEHLQILNGIKRHYEIDAIFHSSNFFRHYSSYIKDHVLKHDLPSFRRRTYFLAHVLLEMLLDRLLIKQYPGLLVEAYKTIKSIKLATVSSYLAQIGKSDFQSEFFNTFTDFIRRQYLFYYTDNEKFISALIWMYNKINPVTPAREEVKQLITLTEQIEIEHKTEMLDIFGWLKKQLSGAQNV